MIPVVRAVLKNILEQEVDTNSNEEITKDEIISALIVKNIYSNGMRSLPVWCSSLSASRTCADSAIAPATVLLDALNNFQTSVEHTFDGSGFAELSSLTSTYPDSSWSAADCQAYDHGSIYGANAKNVVTKWRVAAPTATGTYYLQTCGYINGLKSSVFTTDDVLKGRRSNFTDNIAISSDNRFKRVYCISVYFSLGCTDPPVCTTRTGIDVKTECSVGLFYVSWLSSSFIYSFDILFLLAGWYSCGFATKTDWKRCYVLLLGYIIC